MMINILLALIVGFLIGFFAVVIGLFFLFKKGTMVIKVNGFQYILFMCIGPEAGEEKEEQK